MSELYTTYPHSTSTTFLIHFLHSLLRIFINCSFKISFSWNLYFSGTCCLNLVCQLIFRGHHISYLIFLEVQESHSEQNRSKVLPRHYAQECQLKQLPSPPSKACSTHLSRSEPGLLHVSAKSLAQSACIHSWNALLDLDTSSHSTWAPNTGTKT